MNQARFCAPGLILPVVKGFAGSHEFFRRLRVAFEGQVEVAGQHIAFGKAFQMAFLLTGALQVVGPGEIVSAVQKGEMEFVALQDIPLIGDDAPAESPAGDIAYALQLFCMTHTPGTRPAMS